ncbi:hypothetical protein E2C01_062839 [Portunus trituberculatus]|uniref:Uncharacterized protein n=1 Tax=Portunus trituberculatus TaxID=210409 RepID=A0A5B7HH70_PORTR|nr:hypothetical protein [Portunus trituberculatus]
MPSQPLPVSRRYSMQADWIPVTSPLPTLALPHGTATLPMDQALPRLTCLPRPASRHSQLRTPAAVDLLETFRALTFTSPSVFPRWSPFI